ncbi:DNA helicase [Clostridia bacterium]|nr:DNA helicase [Clostridia bacterium]
MQMDSKHVELLTPLVSKGFVSYQPDSASYVNVGITSHTLHSFCNYWIRQYLEDLKLVGYELARADEMNSYFLSGIVKLKKEFPNLDIKVDRLQTLYDLVYGLNLDYSQIDENNELLIEAIASCNATSDQIRKLFTTYDSTKKFFRRYDFTDMLTKMNKLLERDDVCARIHICYTCVVVDEIQDFTPLMMTILRKIVSPTARLLAIGDEDQSIYGFRGADVNNAVRFQEHFPESKAFQLVTNRRCGDKILEAASKVIGLNSNRFSKKLVAERIGGSVKLLPYDADSEQLQKLTQALHALPQEERLSTVVCSREKVYGAPITFALFKAQIPFYTLNSFRFDYHEVFKDFVEVMALLWKPCRDNWKNLYKVLNVRKDEWFDYIQYDPKKNEVRAFPDKNSLWELEYKPFIEYKGFRNAIHGIHNISKKINSLGCSEYIEYVLELFRRNFWNIRSSMEKVMWNNEAFDWVNDIFNKDVPYPILYEGFVDKMETVKRNQMKRIGVTIATMHALKGLEFKNVYVTFMADSIFPAFRDIDAKGYSQEISLSLKEAESRLAYVAMTRAKDNLTLYYPRSDPSFYINVLLAGTSQAVERTPQIVFSNKTKWGGSYAKNSSGTDDDAPF